MRKMNKKGLELSINFIVILVISIAIFGMGIYFVSTIFIGSSDVIKTISQQEETQLEKRLMTGREKVVIPIETKTMKRGEAVVFGIGIFNNMGSTKTFSVDVTPGPMYKEDRSIELTPTPGVVTENPVDQIVKNNEYKIARLTVRAPPNTDKGRYQINIQVKDDTGADYDTIRLIYINVE
ncbi:hypothetical protein K9M79_00525 [Candidatus Woesearchaeota archaeon]|nr:hypothetical protein [Candidatus Woesearchaeota archaeon]